MIKNFKITYINSVGGYWDLLYLDEDEDLEYIEYLEAYLGAFQKEDRSVIGLFESFLQNDDCPNIFKEHGIDKIIVEDITNKENFFELMKF